VRVPHDTARRFGEYRLLLALVGVVVASYVLAQLVLNSLDPTLPKITVDIVEATTLGALSTAGLWFGIIRGLREQHRAQDFDQRLQTALQMASNEAAGYDVVLRAVDVIAVGGRTQLMLADSSEAHLKTAVDHHGDDSVTGCAVTAPFDCPAIRNAQTSRFDSDRALDACPWLINRAKQAGDTQSLGAVCIPLTVVGRSIGVLHVATSASDLPSASKVRDLESIAERSGARIGMLRVMEQTHLQAATDPLTGLLNRRSLENKVHELLRGHRPFAVAMGDLDHFKKLNDTYGHNAGDRALRVFASTVRGALRTDDLISRYGGEEFVLVFPGLTPNEAASALERVREALALAVNSGAVQPFTASFGVAGSTDADGIEELLRLADTALFQAKRQGRNRVVIDRSSTPGDPVAATG
jgi:diguanylate cyclase (GGDEF)-like protein